MVHLEPAPADSPATSHPLRGEATCRLVAASPGPENGFELAPGTYSLGRSADCELRLDVSGVSRHHARVVVDRDGLLLEDLGSKNGTFVEDRRIRSSRVPAGGRIRVGPVALRLEPVHPDDLVVALFTAGEEGAGEGLREEASTASLEEEPGLRPVRDLGGLEEVARRLLVPDPEGLRRALESLLAALGAEGGCVVRRDGTGSPWMVATSGPVPPEWIVREAVRMLRASSTAAPDRVCLDATSGADGRWVGLASTGGGPAVRLGVGLFRRGELRDREWALVASFLRLVRTRLEGGAPAPDPAVAAPCLDLPAGFVPGRSPAMLSLYDQLALLARSDIPVLLSGETGSGKEVLAQVLHASSRRRRGALVAINCAAIPAELLEAELFGIGPGVATGVAGRPGRFVEADGGTLFLDEIGEMALPLQAKLLRALEEGRIQPLGRPARAVEVRIVAATNADLRSRAREGSFREDLFYRIAGCELRVPPLRDRPIDVPVLVEHFLQEEAEAQGKRIVGVSVRALELLCRYRWPGNVRELRNEVRRLVHLCPAGRPIDSTHLSEHIRLPAADLRVDPDRVADGSLELAPRVERLERNLIAEALRRTAGNVSRSARLLGLSRNGLKLKLRRYEIPAERWRES